MVILDTCEICSVMADTDMAEVGTAIESPGTNLATWGWGTIMNITTGPPPPGTATIIGTVTSKKDGKPVPSAAVKLVGQATYSATTGSDGTYLLSGVATGNYTLTFTASGFKTLEMKVTITAGSNTQNAVLEPANKWLMWAVIGGVALVGIVVVAGAAKEKPATAAKSRGR